MGLCHPVPSFCIAAHCNALQHIAANCNTLQYTYMYCHASYLISPTHHVCGVLQCVCSVLQHV